MRTFSHLKSSPLFKNSNIAFEPDWESSFVVKFGLHRMLVMNILQSIFLNNFAKISTNATLRMKKHGYSRNQQFDVVLYAYNIFLQQYFCNKG